MPNSPKRPGKDPQPSAVTPARGYRREIRFLILFVLLLGGGFALLSLNQVNDAFVEPFTAGIADVSARLLNLLGQDVSRHGTRIHGASFAVDIRNGCNGLETVAIFTAAVLAFPASWRARGVGLLLGILAIQLVNLVRIVALYLTGVYFPSWFNSSHTVVWQSIVIAFGVLLWIFWAGRFALPKAGTEGAATAA